MACHQLFPNESCLQWIVSHSFPSLHIRFQHFAEEILLCRYLCLLFSTLISTVPPSIVVRQETVYASFGQKIVLECISESHPNSFNYWLDPSGKKIIQGAFSAFKWFCHSVSIPGLDGGTWTNFFFFLFFLFEGGIYESMTIENVYRVIMKLVIRPKNAGDFGAYKCIANNTLGESEKIIHLHRKLNFFWLKLIFVNFIN